MEQFTLHGDLSIRLHPPPWPGTLCGPGFGQVRAEGGHRPAGQLPPVLRRPQPGAERQDTFTVEVRQQLPGECGGSRPGIRGCAGFRRTTATASPVRGGQSVGLNIFFIRLDADSEGGGTAVPAAELNNELVRSNGEPGSAVHRRQHRPPGLPAGFCAGRRNPITPQSSTTDALAPERTHPGDRHDRPVRQPAETANHHPLQRGG